MLLKHKYNVRNIKIISGDLHLPLRLHPVRLELSAASSSPVRLLVSCCSVSRSSLRAGFSTLDRTQHIFWSRSRRNPYNQDHTNTLSGGFCFGSRFNTYTIGWRSIKAFKVNSYSWWCWSWSYLSSVHRYARENKLPPTVQVLVSSGRRRCHSLFHPWASGDKSEPFPRSYWTPRAAY